jgi:hypothetical protein
MNTVLLTLVPDASAKKIPGFTAGASLVLKGTVGETVGTLIARLNTYRSPESQIKRIWRDDDTILYFSTVLNANLIGIVKGYSC